MPAGSGTPVAPRCRIAPGTEPFPNGPHPLPNPIFDNPIALIISLVTSVLFTIVAGTFPPGGGALMGSVFLSGMASFLGGEEGADDYEKQIIDEDI